MYAFLRLGCLAATFLFTSTVFSQNILITYQKSDALFVCGSDTFFVQVTNTGGVPITDATLTINLPSGMIYQVGSAQGVTEQNVDNPSSPVFIVPTLPVAGVVSTMLLLTADCAAATALDAGQLFIANLSVTSPQGNVQITTLPFSIETGLLLIDSIDHALLSGERYDTLYRKIWVRNTRLGKIGALHFEDAHQAGFDASVEGSSVQTNNATFFAGNFDGSFFMAFGDGDEWLELGETACFTERIVITDCGFPSFTNSSVLRVGWGCGDQVCRYDSLIVGTVIQPSTKTPDLHFTSIWSPPMDQCGELPSSIRVKIKNTGRAAAENVLITFQPVNPLSYGMEPTSFRLVSHGNTTPLPPNAVSSLTLQSCSKEFASSASLVIPSVPALDSLELVFDTYYCIEVCSQELGTFTANYFYHKICPTNGFVSDTLLIQPDSKYSVDAKVSLNIGTCLQDGHVYPMGYTVKSGRLLENDGFLNIVFTLPWGLSLDESCALLLGGVGPNTGSTSGLPGQPTTISLSFHLPLPDDSLYMPLCLRYDCKDSMDCVTGGDELVLPESGGTFAIITDPIGSCGGNSCLLPARQQTYWSRTMNGSPECGIGICQDFPIAVERCTPGGEGSGPGSPHCCDSLVGLPGSEFNWDFKTYRINFGIQDNDDNRAADSDSFASGPGLRRDRYLPGDTMRVEYQGYVSQGGGYSNFDRVIWNEVAGSDLGGNTGNDDFSAQAAQINFMNADSFQHVRDFIRIRYANGTVVKCEIDDKTYQSDQHYFNLYLVNTIPPSVLDQLSSQRHIFKANLNDLYDDGCLPKPTLDAGDSIFFYSDFRIRPNFRPNSSNLPKPPLVGFRTAVAMTDAPFAWNNFPSRKSQYSGYKIARQSNLIAIRSCETSVTVQPYRFRIDIARENMFPKEVRPLVHILDYKQTFPVALQPESARLLYLALQDSVPLLENIPLDFMVFDTVVSVNFDPAFTELIDEGFVLAATLQFQPNCQFDLPDSSEQTITYQFTSGIHEPQIVANTYENPLGFYANQPRLEFSSPDTIVDIPTSEFGLNFTLKNLYVTAAPNPWVAVVSPSGQALDFELLQTSPAQTLPGTNGIFQLTSMGGFSQRDFRLLGRNTGCDQDSLLIIFGWGCTPFTDLNQSTCHRDTFVVQLRPQSPELELEITQQPPSILLCTESDYFEIEIYNAKVGYAFDPFATVKLPAGLTLVPGSCEISYPSGSPYQSISDPQLLTDNFYQWALDSLNPAIAATGLPGVDLSPQNSLRIRFRTLAQCGFVANAQPFFGTYGESACGRDINVLNKPGAPLQITGLNAGYDVTMSIQPVDNEEVYCGGTQAFQVSMSLGGPPATSDSVYISLPIGATLVAGSYEPQQNAPNGPPTLVPGGFRVPLPTNVQAGTLVRFQFSLAYDQTAGCSDQHVLAQTRIQAKAYCDLISDSCTVYVATGESITTISLQRPELTLSNVTLQVSNTGQISATILINNVGTVPAGAGVHAEIWQDVDASGTLTPGDTLLQTITTSEVLLPGASLPLSSVLNFNLAEMCHLLVVLPAASNCACSQRVLPLPKAILQHPAIQSCMIQPIRFGTPSQFGSTYQWLTTAGILCDTCAITTYFPPDDVLAGQPQIFFLEEKRGDCSLVHRFEIVFGTAVPIFLPSATICAGETATLAPTPSSSGATYLWLGPNLMNPAAPQQTVQPNTTTNYSVIMTFTGGCTSTASTTVTVLKADSLYLSPITTCEGVQVSILDKMTAVAGMYSLHVPQASGCDSVLFQELLVLPKVQSSEARSFCTGQSLSVFDTVLTQSGEVCRTFQAANGCDSTHCIMATKLPLPVVPIPDTVFGEVGEIIDINGPSGYAQYVWVPNVNNCNNCATLEVEPDSAGIYQYLLSVTDANGCATTVRYRLLVFPPCNPGNVLIPNAFTPNDDHVNDVFEAIGERAEVVSKLTIFDRWGEKVYENSGKVFWDGTIDGKPAPPDVYVYIIEISCGADPVKKVGEVTLLR